MKSWIKYKGYLVIFVLMFCYYSTYSQTYKGTDLSNIVPPSPEAASLGKYGNVPISVYSGLPNISVPIYTIQSKDINVPISISYFSSGIKIEEDASWAGLGWSLMAGGVITQSVRGIDDELAEHNYGDFLLPENRFKDSPTPYYWYDRISPDCKIIKSDGTSGSLFDDFSNNFYDLEPDLYSFNFLSFSGKFIRKSKNEIIVLDQQKIQFFKGDPFLIAGTNKNTEAWTARTPDGFIYYFGAVEETILPQEGTQKVQNRSYYLSKILSPKGTSVNFFYKKGDKRLVRYYYNTSLSMFIVAKADLVYPTGCGGGTPSYLYPLALDRIEFTNGKILFISNTVRRDLEVANQLDAIEIYNNDQKLKEFEFQYDYFYPDGSFGNGVCSSNSDYYGLRLKLLSVKEKGGAKEKNPYYFYYNETHNLPYKTSYAKDYWGYFNGVSNPNSSYCIPNDKRFNIPMELYNHIAVNDFANREPEFEYTQTATLSKIVYPTGGSTEFFYEPNEYDNNENEQRTEEYSIPNVAYAVDGHRHIESEEFEITNPFLNVSIEVNLKRPKDCSYSTDIPNCREISNEIFYVQLIGVGNYSDGLPNNTCQVWSIYDAETLKNVKDYFELKPGTYKLISNIPSCGGASDYDSFAEISVYYKKMVDIPEKSIGGGLRINKIVDNDPINPTKKQIRAYKYYQGKLMSPPSFMRNIHFPEQKFVIETDKGPIEMSSPETTIYNLYSYSNLPLSSSASGSFVGYNLVEEWQGENAENGKTIYEYHNQPDKLINPMCGDLVSRFFNIPTISDPLNGLLMHKTVLNSALKTTYELINLYTEELAEGSILNPIRNRQIYWGYLFEFFGYADFSPLCSHTILHQYPIFSQKVELEKTIEKTYDSNSNNYVTTTKEYIYNNDRLLQSQSEIASDGSNITTKFKYPLDYKKEAMGLVGGKYILEEMVNKNIINPTIEKQVLKSNELISSEVTKYNFFGDSKQFILPKEVYVLETNKPLTSTTYKEIKDVDGKYQDAVPDLDFWKEKMSLNYDSYANLVSQQKTKGIPTSYIWGYNNTLPVAKIVGVSCDDISLQTGKSCTEYDETNVESLRDNEYLKKEAMITTYKYEPLKGMTSAIDENGKVTHYDYDDLGRLEFIKDNELNVLKKYIYHYAGQPIVK